MEVSEEYDRWFREKVQQALDDKRPLIPHEDVERKMAERRTAALRKSQTSGAEAPFSKTK